MPLALNDGYTLSFSTPTEVTDGMGGRVIEDGLSVITGLYRPPLFEEVQTYRYDHTRAASGKEQARVVAQFIVNRVCSWDVTLNGQSCPATLENVLRLPDPYVNLILTEVMKWKPKSEEAARGNSPAG